MHNIDIQYAVPKKIPGVVLLKRWATAAINKKIRSAEVTIRLVELDEMIELNTTYRHKTGPTNVLAFPFDMPDAIKSKSKIVTLGDIVICSDVVNREATEQNKPARAHWAHMVVHGLLHLQGYDHVKEKEADIMEAKEIRILKSLGFPNPYHIVEK